MKERLYYIDQLRGLIMLTVIAVHMSYNVVDLPQGLSTLMNVIGNFRMPLFFYVSGFIISKVTSISNCHQLFYFYIKKFCNLLLPSFFWTCIVSHLFFTGSPSIPTLNELGECLIGDQFWFLSTLFYFMVPVGIYKLVINKYTSCSIVILILFLLFECVFVFMYLGLGILQKAVLYFPYFVFGIIASMYAKIDNIINKDVSFALSFVVFCFASGYWMSGATSCFNIVIRFVSAISAIVFFYNLVRRLHWNDRVDKVVRLVGVNTLSVYLCHFYMVERVSLSSNWVIATIELFFYSLVIALVCVGIFKIISINECLAFVFFGKIRKKHN